MHQQFNISPDEAKRAKWPHEILLINLIFNHILVFAATFGVVSTFPLLPLVVPAISFAITGYILLKAQSVASGNDTWFVKAHWKIAAGRNRFFMLLLAFACVISGTGLGLSKMLGWSKIATIALIGGAGMLPFMVTILVLVVLGNESVYMARDGKLPERFAAQNPQPSQHR